MPIVPSRRDVLIATVGLGALLVPSMAMASEVIGTTMRVQGEGVLTRAKGVLKLQAQGDLIEGDRVKTMKHSFAELQLFTQTQINLGPDSSFAIDRFVADLGGVITIGGAMAFDRPEGLPPLDLTLRSAFAQIGVRGTRFFAGRSKGVYSVFVDRGSVQISAGGRVRRLQAGDGIEVPVAGDDPGPVVKWGAARIAAAFASVGL
ncbi:MAG: FecR domain-containing protein [Paracoccaceae bacterium]